MPDIILYWYPGIAWSLGFLSNKTELPLSNSYYVLGPLQSIVYHVTSSPHLYYPYYTDRGTEAFKCLSNLLKLCSHKKWAEFRANLSLNTPIFVVVLVLMWESTRGCGPGDVGQPGRRVGNQEVCSLLVLQKEWTMQPALWSISSFQMLAHIRSSAILRIISIGKEKKILLSLMLLPKHNHSLLNLWSLPMKQYVLIHIIDLYRAGFEGFLNTSYCQH